MTFIHISNRLHNIWCLYIQPMTQKIDFRNSDFRFFAPPKNREKYYLSNCYYDFYSYLEPFGRACQMSWAVPPVLFAVPWLCSGTEQSKDTHFPAGAHFCTIFGGGGGGFSTYIGKLPCFDIRGATKSGSKYFAVATNYVSVLRAHPCFDMRGALKQAQYCVIATNYVSVLRAHPCFDIRGP